MEQSQAILRLLAARLLPSFLCATAAWTVSLALVHPPAAAQVNTPPAARTDGVFLGDPAAVRSLGLTTVWQDGVGIARGTTAKSVHTSDPEGDSVFVLDSGPGLTRVLVRDGRTVWRDRIGERSDRVLSLARSPRPKRDEVVICLDGGIVAADFTTGRLVARHKITRLPITPAVVTDDFAVFGSKAGQVVWQQLSLGALMHVNGVRGTVIDAPLLLDDGVAVGSSDGEVALFSATGGKAIWRHDVGAGVAGNLAADPVSVYARCNDHSVHAMDMQSGKLRWRWKSSDNLSGRLFAGGGLVLTRIEGGDLVALESLRDTSTDMTLRDGRVAWRSSVNGDPLCVIDDDIMLWDERTHTATTVSVENGKVSAVARFPDVIDIAVTSGENPDIYFLASTGLLQRCATIKRAPASPPLVPAAKSDTEAEPAAPASEPDAGGESESTEP